MKVTESVLTSFPLTYPDRISLAQLPTPLQLLGRLSKRLGGPRIWVKRDDLTGSHLSGNKVRKLEFVVAKALAEGCDTLITCGGTQSNHCRATALVAAQLGLKAHLLLRQDDEYGVDGNLLLDQLAGAEISIFEKIGFASKLEQRFSKCIDYYQSQGHNPFKIPTGASDGVGVWGYIACAQELKADFIKAGIAPKYIVSATGSGGTQAGLTVGSVAYNLNAKVIGMAVCDNARYFHKKVDADIAKWRSLYNVDVLENIFTTHVNDLYVGPGYGEADPEIYQLISGLAREEGLILDSVYTAKAFFGLLEEIKLGNFNDTDDIVFVHTGGLFSVFPQRHKFE